jgi:hypothetical protein
MCIKIEKLVVVFFMFTLFEGCGQDDERGQIFYEISRIYSITRTTATFEGTLTSTSPRTDIIAVGYSITETRYNDFSNNSISTFSDKKSGIITCKVSGLYPKTSYYVATVIHFKDGTTVTGVSQKLSFRTL